MVIWIVTASWDNYTEVVAAYTTEKAALERVDSLQEAVDVDYSNVAVSAVPIDLLT